MIWVYPVVWKEQPPPMNTYQAECLCVELMEAETGQMAIDSLKKFGYWDDPSAWRPLGDDPGNTSTVANQQSDPIAALAEKITNSIDARLINACKVSGANPESPGGPRTPSEAVAVFIDQRPLQEALREANVWDWTDKQRTSHAEQITVAVSGSNLDIPASVSVADAGEGQMPRMFPQTLCSLRSSNKDRIPFAQGRYNMGGTGSLRFCGVNHLQLIVSRRNPAFQEGHKQEDDMWGFSVIRREDPKPGHKNVTYTYLAPVEPPRTGQGWGSVLAFPKKSLGIFPDSTAATKRMAPKPFGREARYGTFVKMYDYLPHLTKRGVNATHNFSLLRHLELCLVNMPLPVRLYDCRRPSTDSHNLSGGENLYGVMSRLDREDASALEDGFPLRLPITIQNQQLVVTVYAFGLGGGKEAKTPKARMYRSSDFGLVFTLNNQTHAKQPWQFYHRQEVGMGFLSNSLLVNVDCSGLIPRVRDDLFMASRDRIADNEFSKRLLQEIADAISSNPKLRELKYKRTRELGSSNVEPSELAANVIRHLYASDKALAKYLLEGTKLHLPKEPPPATPFMGKPHPTYFAHAKQPAEHHVDKTATVGKSASVSFKTDALDDYFTRDNNPGVYDVRLIEPHLTGTLPDDYGYLDLSRLVLKDGDATLTLKIANAKAGETYRYEILVDDQTTLRQFRREFTLVYRASQSSSKAGSSTEVPNYQLPQMQPVPKDVWASMSPPFTDDTAVRIYHSGDGNKGASAYSWFWNPDNAHLISQSRAAAQKKSSVSVDEIKTMFYQVMLLAGLSALRTQERLAQTSETANPYSKDKYATAEASIELPTPEDFVAYTTAALAPIAWQTVASLSQAVRRTSASEDSHSE